MRYSRILTWIFVVFFLFCGFTAAQDAKKEAQLRTVRGVVSDKSDNPLAGSVVFLKNLRDQRRTQQFCRQQRRVPFQRP